MSATLVIMAAGLGSRYGGSKQVDGVGPNNEILLEYAVYDALRAGFNKVVFIIKPEMEELMERLGFEKTHIYRLRDRALTRIGEIVADEHPDVTLTVLRET